MTTIPARTFLAASLLAWLALGLLLFEPAAADEFVEVAVPLREGRFFSPRDLCAECNQRLGTHFPLLLIPDGEHRLSDNERRALLLAAAAGVLPIRLEDQRLVIRVPNPQDDAARRRYRELIEKYLGISMDWPDGKGLHVPEGFRPAAPTLLLIHGLESNADDFDRFVEAARNCDVQTLIFDYPNDGPIAWSGDRLSEELKTLEAKYPDLRIAIVAHSMGGLVARYCLETPGKQPACVTDLVMLGTPQTGSRLSGAQPWMQLYRESFSMYALRGGILQDGLGEAAVDLRPGSDFLKALNARPRPPAGVKYHVAAGTKSLIPASVFDSAELAAARLTKGKSRDQLLAFLAAPELRDERGDGAVAVENALLAGVESRRTFDLNHRELISLPGDTPQSCEVFRWVLESLSWRRE